MTSFENLEQRIIDCIDIVQREKTEADLIRKRIQEHQEKKNLALREIERIEKAQNIIQIVAKETQQTLQYHISDLVTLAMEYVFQQDIDVVLEYLDQNGKTIVDINVRKEGKSIDPLFGSGGGVVDICSFALQLALWSLQPKRSRPVLILDEPLIRLKGSDLPVRGLSMIKQLCTKLGMQVIMVSHDAELIEGADKVFHITQDSKGISQIKERKF
jgi:wobble nucleotide-excising tRNase